MLYQLSYLGVLTRQCLSEKAPVVSILGGKRRAPYSHGYPTKDLAEKVRANIALDLAAGRGGLKGSTPGHDGTG